MRENSNEITIEYFDRILLKMRLIDAEMPNTEMQLFGRTYASPVMTAALSHLGRTEMVDLAQGAKEAGALVWYGMGPDEELEQMAETGADIVKIIKPHRDNALIRAKIDHAKRCGAVAVGVDIDHSFNMKGEYDLVDGMEMRPKTTGELKELVQYAGLPFIVKGVLSEEDARKCADIGAAGIVLSHHNNRMNSSVAPLQMLPSIRKVVGEEMKIFVDGRVDTGTAAFKALALGADAVSVGNALIPPVREGKAEGVRDYIRAMNDQLAKIMAFTGYKTVDEIDSRCVYFDK